MSKKESVNFWSYLCQAYESYEWEWTCHNNLHFKWREYIILSSTSRQNALLYTCKVFFPTTISNVPYKRVIILQLLHAHCSYCTVTSSSNYFSIIFFLNRTPPTTTIKNKNKTKQKSVRKQKNVTADRFSSVFEEDLKE